MERFFNNAGPTKPELHYHIDPLTRLDWDEIQQLIREQRYFVLHAPRQTGKTSTLLAMMKALNEAGIYACAYANIEGAQAARGDETQGIPTACEALIDSIERQTGHPTIAEWYKIHKAGTSLSICSPDFWAYWCETTKPTVLLLDAVDALGRRYPDFPVASGLRRLRPAPRSLPSRLSCAECVMSRLPHASGRWRSHHRWQRL